MCRYSESLHPEWYPRIGRRMPGGMKLSHAESCPQAQLRSRVALSCEKLHPPTHTHTHTHSHSHTHIHHHATTTTTVTQNHRHAAECQGVRCSPGTNGRTIAIATSMQCGNRLATTTSRLGAVLASCPVVQHPLVPPRPRHHRRHPRLPPRRRLRQSPTSLAWSRFPVGDS